MKDKTFWVLSGIIVLLSWIFEWKDSTTYVVFGVTVAWAIFGAIERYFQTISDKVHDIYDELNELKEFMGMDKDYYEIKENVELDKSIRENNNSK